MKQEGIKFNISLPTLGEYPGQQTSVRRFVIFQYFPRESVRGVFAAKKPNHHFARSREVWETSSKINICNNNSVNSDKTTCVLFLTVSLPLIQRCCQKSEKRNKNKTKKKRWFVIIWNGRKFIDYFQGILINSKRIFDVKLIDDEVLYDVQL